MKPILLFGPRTIKNKNVYGGGVGGYTRNMNTYIKAFNGQSLRMIPCYHSVRGEIKLHILTPLYRILKDTIQLLRAIYTHRPSAIHLLAQYRGAAIREFLVTVISKALGLKVIYDIKAGAFISSYEARGFLYKKIVKYIICNSNLVLCEGKNYISFIEANFHTTAYYFPNFVLSEEIPDYKMKFGPDSPLNVLFVGYAYKEKGVFELLDAIIIAHEEFPVKLTIIGEEHHDFTTYLNKVLRQNPQLIVDRLGVLPHAQVLSTMALHNVYAYPTTHAGEGHNNSINEAMMNSLYIVTTRNGFLPDVLGTGLAHHMDEVTPTEIYEALRIIKKSFKVANSMTWSAYEKLKNQYSSEAAVKRLLQYYQYLT